MFRMQYDFMCNSGEYTIDQKDCLSLHLGCDATHCDSRSFDTRLQIGQIIPHDIDISKMQ